MGSREINISELGDKTVVSPSSNNSLEKNRSKMEFIENARLYSAQITKQRMRETEYKEPQWLAKITNENFSYKVTDAALKTLFQRGANIEGRRDAEKAILALSVEMKNNEEASITSRMNVKDMESYRNLILASITNSAIEWAFSESTSSSIETINNKSTSLHSDKSKNIDYKEYEKQLKSLPIGIIDKLALACNTSKGSTKNPQSKDNAKITQHNQIVLNAQDILLNSDNYLEKYKKIIRSTRAKDNIISNISSMSEALENLCTSLEQVKNTHLSEAIKQIDEYLQPER